MKEKNTDTLVNVYVYFCNGTHINVLKLLLVTQYQMLVPSQLQGTYLTGVYNTGSVLKTELITV